MNWSAPAAAFEAEVGLGERVATDAAIHLASASSRKVERYSGWRVDHWCRAGNTAGRVVARKPGVFVRPVTRRKAEKLQQLTRPASSRWVCVARDRGAGIGAGHPVLLIRRLHQRARPGPAHSCLGNGRP